jgi:SPP1 gp7 family putative phage head morphogenesis protein
MIITADQLAKIHQRRVGKADLKKKLKKPPKWHFPSSQEREYTRLLFSLINELKLQIQTILIPEIPYLILEVERFYPKPPIRKDDFQDTLKMLINSVIRAIKGKTEKTILEAEKIGVQVASYNKKQFDKITNSVFGIDIFIDQPWLQDQLKLFASQNAQLIRSLPEQELSQVAGIVERGLQEGSRFNSITQSIQERFGITKRRAKLIARDQTTKLNASLTKLRQQELGVTEYEWQTAGDERVRPSHRAHDGKKFKWDRPPKDTGHPGTDVNCRCVAVPVLEDLLDL